MLISLPLLQQTLKNVVRKFVTEREATYVAEELLEAYIRKYPRTNILKDEVVADARRFLQYKNNRVEVVFDLPGYIRYNFNHLPMTFHLKKLHDTLEKKAKKNGIAMAAFDNSGGMHSLHTWAQGLAKRGYFVFGAYNGGPDAVIPFGGTKGLLGTNPITYGFPSEDGIVVVDMATSEIPFFEMNDAKRDGKKLPEGAAVDQQGEPTTDPEKAFDATGTSNIRPMGGGYKGYAINYLVEIMTASLIGAKLSTKQDPSYVNEDHGGFLVVISPNIAHAKGSFERSVQEFNDTIRAQKPRKGYSVLVPGDKNQARWKQALSVGETEVEPEVWSEVLTLAA